MKLAIISDNKIHQNALSQALNDHHTDVRTYSVDEVIEQDTELSIFIIEDGAVVSMKEKAQLNEFVAIMIDKMADPTFFQEHARAVFEAPIKLGRIVDYIATYTKQKSKKAALSPIKLGSYTLNPHASELVSNGDSKAIKLTEKECNILIYLSQNKGESVSRQSLLDNVWGYAQDVETHTLETHIYRLRQKLEKDASVPSFLMTDDQGYYLSF